MTGRFAMPIRAACDHRPVAVIVTPSTDIIDQTEQDSRFGSGRLPFYKNAAGK
ncbi:MULTISPECIES: hypothetical protein [Sphingobium]|jgi:hypothetical protein|uniref:hypothetical protein n=1 Tax=Sphingobium TaxID=165695 RepID=UPI0013761E34|nr:MULTISPECIES: hypothetical protein [Sphingobium]